MLAALWRHAAAGDLTLLVSGSFPACLDPIARYVGAARRSGGRAGRPKTRTQVGTSAREIRDWARSNGHKVPDRGRIPSEVREAFEAAH